MSWEDLEQMPFGIDDGDWDDAAMDDFLQQSPHPDMLSRNGKTVKKTEKKEKVKKEKKKIEERERSPSGITVLSPQGIPATFAEFQKSGHDDLTYENAVRFFDAESIDVNGSFHERFLLSLRPVVKVLIQFKKLRRLIVDDVIAETNQKFEALQRKHANEKELHAALKKEKIRRITRDTLQRKYRTDIGSFVAALLERGKKVLQAYTLPVAIDEGIFSDDLIVQFTDAKLKFVTYMQWYEVYLHGHRNASTVQFMRPCEASSEKLNDVALEFLSYLLKKGASEKRLSFLAMDLRLLANRPTLRIESADDYKTALKTVLGSTKIPSMCVGSSIYESLKSSQNETLGFLNRLFCAGRYFFKGVDDHFFLPKMLQPGNRPVIQSTSRETVVKMFYEILTLARLHVDFRLFRTIMEGEVHSTYPKLHRIPNPLKNTMDDNKLDMQKFNDKVEVLRGWLNEHGIVTKRLVRTDTKNTKRSTDAAFYQEYDARHLIKVREALIRTLEANNCDLALYGTKLQVHTGLAKYVGRVVMDPMTGKEWVFAPGKKRMTREELALNRYYQIVNVTRSNQKRVAMMTRYKNGESTLFPYCTVDPRIDKKFTRKFAKKNNEIEWPCVKSDGSKGAKRVPIKEYEGAEFTTKEFSEEGGADYYHNFPTEDLFFDKAYNEEDVDGGEVDAAFAEDDHAFDNLEFDFDDWDQDPPQDIPLVPSPPRHNPMIVEI